MVKPNQAIMVAEKISFHHRVVVKAVAEQHRVLGGTTTYHRAVERQEHNEEAFDASVAQLRAAACRWHWTAEQGGVQIVHDPMEQRFIAKGSLTGATGEGRTPEEAVDNAMKGNQVHE